MTSQSVNIDPAVAYAEVSAQLEFFRNRTLILAQAVSDLSKELDAAKAELQIKTGPDAAGQKSEG